MAAARSLCILPSLLSLFAACIHVSKQAVVIAILFAAGCAPVVTHGPRVHSGVSLYGTGGGGTRLCDTLTCDTEMVPQLGVGVRYGHAATASAPGLSAAVTLSGGVVSSEVDLYVQAPTSFPGLDVGAGLLSGGAHTLPYVQAGRIRADGSGWYATLGYARLSPRSPEWSLSAEPRRGVSEVEPRYWAPTLAYRVPGEKGLHVYVSGAFGTARAVAYSADTLRVPTTTRQPVSVVMAGMIFDLQPLVRPLRVPSLPRPVPGVPPPAAGRLR